MIKKGNDPFANITPVNQDITDTYSVHSGSVSPVQSSPSSSEMQCPVPALIMREKIENETPIKLAINFLMDSYNRVAQEERNHPKRYSQDSVQCCNSPFYLIICCRSSIPPLSDVLIEVRAQLIQYTTLVVQGIIVPKTEDAGEKSPLLNSIVHQTFPR